MIIYNPLEALRVLLKVHKNVFALCSNTRESLPVFLKFHKNMFDICSNLWESLPVLLKFHKNIFDLWSNPWEAIPVLLKFHKSCVQTLSYILSNQIRCLKQGFKAKLTVNPLTFSSSETDGN